VERALEGLGEASEVVEDEEEIRLVVDIRSKLVDVLVKSRLL
jgi:hypothetical protein